MCEVACADFHYTAISPKLARIRVAKIEDIGIDVAIACVGCAEKPCLDCPTEALSVQASGEIVVDKDLCTGCMECVNACPIGAVGFHDDHPLFCDLCGITPACTMICPTEALVFEKKEQPSLEEFLEIEGSPSQKRVHYANVQAEPIRKKWMEGWRLGP